MIPVRLNSFNKLLFVCRAEDKSERLIENVWFSQRLLMCLLPHHLPLEGCVMFLLGGLGEICAACIFPAIYVVNGEALPLNGNPQE